MEIVDELVTPGCPNCYVKHMTAALSYFADMNGQVGIPSCARALAARAVINLAETVSGYRSHFDFALGLLERAEEAFVGEGSVDDASILRLIRTELMEDRDAAIAAAVASIRSLATYLDFYWAHVQEAKRELPSSPAFEPTYDGLSGAIEKVRNEYFNIPEEEPKEKGGEEVMACGSKKPAKKAAPAGKAAMAACKGSKCKSGKKGCK